MSPTNKIEERRQVYQDKEVEKVRASIKQYWNLTFEPMLQELIRSTYMFPPFYLVILTSTNSQENLCNSQHEEKVKAWTEQLHLRD